MKFNFYIVFLSICIIITTLFTNVKSDITDIDEINSISFLANTFFLNWDLRSGKICSNKGIFCDSTNSTTMKIFIDENLSSGEGIPSNLTLPGGEILSLSFINISSITIRNRESNTATNILNYISAIKRLSYLEIVNVSSINIIPDSFLFDCPLINTLILDERNITSLIPSSMFSNTGGSLKTLTISISQASSMPWNQLNSIENLNLILYGNSINHNSIININGTFFQFLSNLTINGLNAKVTLTGMNYLKSSSIKCTANDGFYKDFNFTNITSMDTLLISNCLIGSFNFANSNLTDLEIHDGLMTPSSPLSYPKNVEILKIDCSGFDIIPKGNQIPMVKELYLAGGSFKSTIDSFPSLSIVNITNGNLNGELPQSFCSTNEIDLSMNNFTKIPDCFLCHWSYTNKWFSNNLPNSLEPNSSFICNFGIIQNNASGIVNVFNSSTNITTTTFKILSYGQTIIFNGSNLGWSNQNQSVGLKMIKPNTQFSYDFPVESLNKTSETLIFSSGREIKIQWSYYQYEIVNVEFFQKSEGVLANFTGLFDSSSIISIGGIVYTPLILSSHNIQIQFNLSFLEGPIEFDLQTFQIYNFKFFKSFSRSYPLITSASIISVNDSQVTIFGSFFNNIDNNTSDIKPIVFINGVNCNILSFDNESIVTTIPKYPQGGFANLTVNDNGYYFSSPLVVFYEKPKPTECNPSCENGGKCSEGSCECVGDYSGATCSFIKPSNSTYSLVLDKTKPNAKYEMEKGAFDFSLISVQELDLNKKVVKQINITQWDYLPNQMVDGLGECSLYYSNQSNVLIQVFLFVPTESVKYNFAGYSLNIDSGQVKILVNISNWQYQTSLSVLRAVFKSSSLPSNQTTSSNSCGQSDTNSLETTNNQYNALLSFTFQRNGVILYGVFIDKMLSNGRVAISTVESLGNYGDSDNNNNYFGINMPHCTVCLLDPNLGPLVNPGFQCSERPWVLPVSLVVSIVGAILISVSAFVTFKKYYIIARDGKSIKFSKRRKSKSKSSMSKT
ncbi:hypothetical protein RB653_003061 [Dictyostelium firmibasis]|uniref:EGF-like domain-containing protein n=1 Tax=Dictyostelium firmibasis TaxID=79012 RepID=A0AAN7TYY4_9MYCE